MIARELLSFRRANDGSKDAAGAKIDFTVDRRLRRGSEPFLDVLRLGIAIPHKVSRDIDNALKHEVEAGIGLVHCHSSFSFSR